MKSHREVQEKISRNQELKNSDSIIIYKRYIPLIIN